MKFFPWYWQQINAVSVAYITPQWINLEVFFCISNTKEEFEDIKALINIRISKARQYNGHKKTDKRHAVSVALLPPKWVHFLSLLLDIRDKRNYVSVGILPRNGEIKMFVPCCIIYYLSSLIQLPLTWQTNNKCRKFRFI